MPTSVLFVHVLLHYIFLLVRLLVLQGLDQCIQMALINLRATGKAQVLVWEAGSVLKKLIAGHTGHSVSSVWCLVLMTSLLTLWHQENKFLGGWGRHFRVLITSGMMLGGKSCVVATRWQIELSVRPACLAFYYFKIFPTFKAKICAFSVALRLVKICLGVLVQKLLHQQPNN